MSTKTEPHALQVLLSNKKPDLEGITKLALEDEGALRELLDGLVSKDETYRYNCFTALLKISEERPETLIPNWDDLTELMSSDNAYHRSAAVNLLANLLPADREGCFDKLFEAYFKLLDDRSVVVARYVARNAGKIARAAPDLQTRITDKLLGIEDTQHKQGRKDLIKADAIQSFEAYFEAAEGKGKIIAFVEEQLDCSSPTTRKAAKSFLEKYGEE